MSEGDSFYRRRLPHWEKPDATYFVTFRVAGSLPQSLLQQAEAEIRSMEQRVRQQGRSASEVERERRAILERYLDEDRTNPILSNPQLAALVRDALLFHAGRKYDLLAWCIMPNHVHLLLKPLPKGTPPSRRSESRPDTAGTAAFLLCPTGGTSQTRGTGAGLVARPTGERPIPVICGVFIVSHGAMFICYTAPHDKCTRSCA